METVALLDLWRDALVTAAALAAPFLVAALAMGLLASLIQAATQMNENILAFIPKLAAVGLVLALSGTWLLDRATRYTHDAMSGIVRIAKDGRQ